MLDTDRTQSLSEFRATAAQTIARLNQTDEAEILTVDGEARAILLSPALYGELTREVALARDVANIRRSIQQLDAGQGRAASVVFDELRAKLLAMKEQQQKEAAG